MKVYPGTIKKFKDKWNYFVYLETMGMNCLTQRCMPYEIKLKKHIFELLLHYLKEKFNSLI